MFRSASSLVISGCLLAFLLLAVVPLSIFLFLPSKTASSLHKPVSLPAGPLPNYFFVVAKPSGGSWTLCLYEPCSGLWIQKHGGRNPDAEKDWQQLWPGIPVLFGNDSGFTYQFSDSDLTEINAEVNRGLQAAKSKHVDPKMAVNVTLADSSNGGKGKTPHVIFSWGENMNESIYEVQSSGLEPNAYVEIDQHKIWLAAEPRLRAARQAFYLSAAIFVQIVFVYLTYKRRARRLE